MWIIFLVLISTTHNRGPKIKVETYLMGEHDTAHINSLVLQLHGILNQYFRPPDITLQCRLELVPLTFTSDIVFFTYILIHYLQRNGNYLLLSTEKIMLHKLELFPGLLSCHDQWLGKLEVDKITKASHLFLFLPRNLQTKTNSPSSRNWAGSPSMLRETAIVDITQSYSALKTLVITVTPWIPVDQIPYKW